MLIKQEGEVTAICVDLSSYVLKTWMSLVMSVVNFRFIFDFVIFGENICTTQVTFQLDIKTSW